MEQIRQVPLYLEQLIFQFGFFFLLIDYLVTVLFWVDVCHGNTSSLLTNEKNDKILLDNTQCAFNVIAVLLFLFQFTQSTTYGLKLLPEHQNAVTILCGTFVATVILGISNVLLIYGILVARKMRTTALEFGITVNTVKGVEKMSTILTVAATLLSTFVTEMIITVDPIILSTARGAIAIWTAVHMLELMLIAELLYLKR